MNRIQGFNPDVRNIGGRTVLVNQIYNHHRSLDMIKLKPGSSDSCTTVVRKVHTPIAFKRVEQGQTINQNRPHLENIKKTIDNNKPISFDKIRRGDVAGGASKKQSQFVLMEHIKNLFAQQTRIEELGSTYNRKKNFYDYTVYPVKFFRRLNDKQSPLHKLNDSQRCSTRENGFMTAKSILEGNKSSHSNIPSNRNYYFSPKNQGNNALGGQREIPTRKGEEGSDDIQRSQSQIIYNPSSNLNSGNLKISKSLLVQNNLKNQIQLQIQQAGNQQSPHFLNQKDQNNQKNAKSLQMLPISYTPKNPMGNNKTHKSGPLPYQSQSDNKFINSLSFGGATTASKIDKKSPQNSVNHSYTLNNQHISGISPDQSNLNIFPAEISEERWNAISEEIPVLLDINEESIKALKIHLINLILQFRLYRISDYNTMKDIFIFKNPNLQRQLIDEIFTEIIHALNE